MTFNHTPSDRVQLRQLGELIHPACCALCGSGNAEQYVDIGVYYEYEGQVYLCLDNCIAQIIDLVGGLLPEEVKHLRSDSEGIARENADLKEANAALSRQLDAWNSVISNAGIGGSFGPLPADHPLSPPNAEPTVEPESLTGNAVNADSGKPVAKKSSPSPRSNDSSRPKRRNIDV